MSYTIENDETLPVAVRRIGREQIDKAIHSLREQPDGPDEAIHDARKRMKKLRALLRLVREEVGETTYQRENARFRDAARLGSELRDRFVFVETIDALRDRYGESLRDDAFATLRDRLVDEHECTRETVMGSDAVERMIERLERGREHLDDWPLERHGFDAVRGGLRKVYTRGVRRMADAYDAFDDDPRTRGGAEAEAFHEWRKRVKYLWYHTRLLEPLVGGMLDPMREALDELADRLGVAHDLDELARRVDAAVSGGLELFASDAERELFDALLDRRRAALRLSSHHLAERVYAEDPDVMIDRVATYWRSTDRPSHPPDARETPEAPASAPACAS